MRIGLLRTDSHIMVPDHGVGFVTRREKRLERRSQWSVVTQLSHRCRILRASTFWRVPRLRHEDKLSTSPGMATAQESSAAAHALFQEALACQRTGQLVRAETLYRQVVAMQPGHPGAHHLLGTIALQKGAPERACELIRLSIAAQPRLAHSHADLGRALQTLGRPAEAVRSYDRALELQPTLFEVHFNKALALRHLCRFEEALRACHTVLELRPGFTA